MFLLFIPWLICISLPSLCGTSEQREVKAGHLLTSVTSQKLTDLQPYPRWSSAASVCQPIIALSQAQEKICSAFLFFFLILCQFPNTNTSLLNTNTSLGINEMLLQSVKATANISVLFFYHGRGSLWHNV